MGNPVVHFELNGTDWKSLSGFYKELFGWHVQDIPEGNYAVIDTHAGSGINGGIGQSQSGEPFGTFYVECPDGQGHVTVYAEVDDIQKYLEVAESLGGKTVVPITTIAQTTFAQFADPQGIVFGLFKAQM